MSATATLASTKKKLDTHVDQVLCCRDTLRYRSWDCVSSRGRGLSIG
jgi:hypothetical protein